MGFEISSGSGSFVRQGGLLPKGMQVGRLVEVEEVRSKFDKANGDPAYNFQWEVELFNPNGENGWVRIWTNQTLHPRGALHGLVQAVMNDEKPAINDTDDLIGAPFQIMVEQKTIETDEGNQVVNRPFKKPSYVFMPHEGEDPFEQTVQELLESELDGSTGDQSDDIPF